MDDPPLELSTTVGPLQVVAIVLWVLFISVGFFVCAYVIIQGSKKKREPTGFDPVTLMETYGKVNNPYPLILAYSVGGLIVLIPAALFAFSIQDTPFSDALYERWQNRAVEALVTAVVTAFYSILTGYILTTTRGAKTLNELIRGKDLAALAAGVLIGLQLAYSLIILSIP